MRCLDELRPNNESNHNRAKPNRILCCYRWRIFWWLVMGKKILVTKEWYGRAMEAMRKLHELESICDALQKFPYLHLNQEQHEQYQKLLDEYTDRMIDDGKI